mgnify:CR=1 FL=1
MSSTHTPKRPEQPARHSPSLTRVSAGRRLLASALIGAALGALIGALTEPRYAVGSAWCAATLAWLLWVWIPLRRLDPEQTKRLASREDGSRSAADAAITVAALASIGALGFYLKQAAASHGPAELACAALGLGTIALSWLMVHTMYALRYARLYYDEDRGGGIDWNSDEDPDYRDFAYFAFNLGMTYQVSDTSVSSKAIRRVVLQHCLLGFVLGVVILGSAVNIVAGLSA